MSAPELRARRGCGLRHLLAGGIVLAGAACAEVPEEAAEVHEPAAVQEVAGKDKPVIHFEPEAADQVDLRTAPVRATGRGTVVPYAALIYDPAGTVWVYAVEEPLTYSRHQVVVDRIQGRTAWLREGPEPGTRVVTRGATEVYGTELGMAGGH